MSNVKITMRSGAVIEMTVSKIDFDVDFRGRVSNFNYSAVEPSFIPLHLNNHDIESIWVDKSQVTKVTRKG